MNNNINIAELLKDCPKGTKLYSTIFGEVELKEVKDNGRSVCILVTNFYGQEEMFYPDGKYNTHYSDSECTLFPSKEQRDWSKFCPFKDGDVLSDNYSVFIFKSRMFDRGLDSYVYNSHCVLAPNKRLAVKPGGYNHAAGVVSFATEEEKEKLFEAIKDKGCRWNAKAKTLEGLVDTKFKVGDKIIKKGGITAPVLITSVSDEFYYYNTKNPVGILSIKEQDDWELAPKKFDITSFKPFNKVLVRDNGGTNWMIDFFEIACTDGCICYKGNWKMCIPYEGNEHLHNTTNDCDEYYKTWKDETDE